MLSKSDTTGRGAKSGLTGCCGLEEGVRSCQGVHIAEISSLLSEQDRSREHFAI